MNLLIFFLLLAFNTYATDKLIISDVDVNCSQSDECKQRTSRFKTLAGDYRSLVHLKDSLKVMASDGGYQSFNYAVQEENQKFKLNISFRLKPIIREIQFVFSEKEFEKDYTQLVSLKEGEYFEPQKLKENSELLYKKLDSMGFPSNTHTANVIEQGDQVKISFVVNLGEPRKFKKTQTNTKSFFLKDYFNRKFLHLYNKPFDLNQFKIHLDQSQKELFNYGYYLLEIDFIPVYKGKRVILKINVKNDQLYAFDFINLHREHQDIIHDLSIELFRRYKKPVTESSLRTALSEHYKDKSFLNSKFKIQISDSMNKYDEVVQVYRVSFEEDGKTRINNLKFSGNSFFSNQSLRRMYFDEAFELASINYYDREYYTYFQDFLKNQYISNGFLQVRILDPVASLNDSNLEGDIEYTIIEGKRTLIKRIIFTGVPDSMEKKLLEAMGNKLGKPFNPIQFTEDLKNIISVVQENGYYYAEMEGSNDQEVVKYNRSGSEVSLNIKINTGPLVTLNRVLFLGNDKTKRKILKKKITIKAGEIVTPTKTREIESLLSATGLFNSVSVTPLRHKSQKSDTDLLVRVIERDYGLIELAPGYRTDLGIKLTGTVSYQNIGGYNRALTLRSQLNRRTSYSTIEPERRDNIDPLLEHNTSLTFSQGDIFDTFIDASATAGYQARRFYAFDANILRLNGTLSRDLTKKISTSIRYQYEDISQYNATDEINEGSFRIGSLTPSLSLDFRNNQINATEGSYFNLSCEFANPNLFSQRKDDLTINYYKLVSRNRFYVPFKNGTLALSLVGGFQENLATDKKTISNELQTEGYIPTIKVFRLTGMDIIRGFTDQEMNRLEDGNDISEVRVDQKAYLFNFKFEPRYFINDALIAGVFYDAGRVFVNHMNFDELRDSAGITFKIITPVGTLDFDYGIKLLRKRTASGSLEDPGRFHVSIGFF